ncbi:MAG: hypothetical protein AAGU74_11755 [Bacillota bacterium]
MAKEKEELKAILMAQEVYMPDGKTPNTTKLNMISGVIIPSLMDAMCQERDSIGPIEAIEAYLWELYEKSEYLTIAGILRVLYLLHEIAIPEIIDTLLQYGDPTLLGLFLYEFLMDFSDVKLDYKDDYEEIDE